MLAKFSGKVTKFDNLEFDKHMFNICSKANKKLNAAVRVAKFFPFKKIYILFKVFIQSQFKCCPLDGCFMEGKSMIS